MRDRRDHSGGQFATAAAPVVALWWWSVVIFSGFDPTPSVQLGSAR